MGKIFTYDEIQRGDVPDRDAHRHVRALLISELAASDDVVGAQVCGSSARGDWNRRSDIDVAIVYKRRQADSMREHLQWLAQQAAVQHVPVEFITIDDDVAATHDHTFSRLFLEHLALQARSPQNVIKHAVHRLVQQPQHSALEESRAYLLHKIRMFEQARVHWPVLSAERQMRVLQKLLEFPLYASRKVLVALGHSFVFDDGKGAVIAALRERPHLAYVHGAVYGLNEVDRAYSHELEHQLHAQNREEYEARVDRIRTYMPIVLMLAYDFLELLRRTAR